MNSISRDVVRTLLISVGLSVVSTAPLRAEPSSCEEIRDACRNAGFVTAGSDGDRLAQDCFKPIVQGTPRPNGASRRLPNIPPQSANDCRAAIAGNQRSSDMNDSPSVAARGRRGASAETSQSASNDRVPLVPAADGQTVYDGRLNVTWLADGNLAAKQTFGVSNINKSGSMDYATAVQWVNAMNAFDHGAGYLGHKDWQLPTTPDEDRTCAHTGRHGESFGFHCSGSALGSLYYNSLGLREPDTAVQIPNNSVGPFDNFQPYLYWSKSPAADSKQGFGSFSFNTGFQGANVWRNHLYVLPIIKGKLPGTPPAAGEGLEANPGGQTVYDPVAHVTWLANANLAAKQTFGVPDINPDGSMDHKTAVLWVEAMNEFDHGRGYLGQTHWELPETGPSDPSCSMKGTTGFDCTGSAMGELFYKQLRLRRGESVVATPDVKVGPFHNIQPYLYWACDAKTAQLACQSNGPSPGFEWNFSFGNGFEGTNLVRNALYVMVYYPGSSTKTPPQRPPMPPPVPRNDCGTRCQ